MEDKLKAVILNLEQICKVEGINKIVMAGIVKKDHNVLLLKRSSKEDFLPDIDELPGGSVEDGESLITALYREIQEETGLLINKVLSYQGSFDYFSKDDCKTRQLNFIVTVFPGDIILNPLEHQSYTWINSIKELNDSNVTKSTKSILRSVLRSD